MEHKIEKNDGHFSHFLDDLERPVPGDVPAMAGLSSSGKRVAL